MTESDDPVTLAVVAATAVTATSLSNKGGPSAPDIKKKQAVRTAEPLEQVSEQARRNRRQALAFSTRGFEEPTLSDAGLLGF